MARAARPPPPPRQAGDVTEAIGPEVRVEVVTSFEALDRHARAYDALTDRMDGVLFPVFRREWIREGRRRYLQDGASLFFLFAWRGERLIGVAPLVRVPRFLGVTTVHWLGFWGQHSGTTTLENFTGELLIPDPSDAGDCIRAWRDHLTGVARHDWDLLDLRYLCGILPSGDALISAFPEADAGDEEMPGYVVELDGGMEALYHAFGKNAARNLRRSRHRLEEVGHPFSFDAVPTVDAALFDELARVHTGRQQQLAGKGRSARDLPFADPVSVPLLRTILADEGARGRLVIHTLRIDGRLAAFGLLLRNGPGAVYWIIGFDDEFQQLSPSRLLFEELYRRSVEDGGVKRINLLLGHTRTKEELSTLRYSARRIRLANRWSSRSRVRRAILEALKRARGALFARGRSHRVPSP